MTLLLVKNENNTYSLYCPEIYGASTWGQTTQEGIDYKDGKYYLTYWSAGNEWIDDTRYEDEINVVLETKNIDDIVRYFRDQKLPGLGKILNSFAEIAKEYVSVTKWLAGVEEE